MLVLKSQATLREQLQTGAGGAAAGGGGGGGVGGERRGLVRVERRRQHGPSRRLRRALSRLLASHRTESTTVAVGECLDLMMTISDNTAADLMLREVGLARVRERVAAVGMKGTDIHLSQRQAYLVTLGQSPTLAGLSSRQLASRWSSMSVDRKMVAAQEAEAQAASKALSVRDMRALERLSWLSQKAAGARGYWEDVALAAAVDNVGPPADTARLLSKLALGQLLDPQWTAHCLSILSRQQWGARRLPQCLPANVRVLHKTGSILGVVNAAGLIEADGATLSMAVFIRDVRRKHEQEAEAVIARIARLAFNTYCQPPKWMRSRRS
eukprot:jgi/Mesen1/1533/ME000133S00545